MLRNCKRIMSFALFCYMAILLLLTMFILNSEWSLSYTKAHHQQSNKWVYREIYFKGKSFSDLFFGLELAVENIIRQEVSNSSLTGFIRYIYYLNLQFLNNFVFLKYKIKVYLPRTYVALHDFDCLA